MNKIINIIKSNPKKSSDYYSKQEARNYLMLPKEGKIILVFTEHVVFKEVVKICDFYRLENKVKLIIIFVKRYSVISDELVKKYATVSEIKIIITNKQIPIYLCAADLLFCKAENIIVSESIY